MQDNQIDAFSKVGQPSALLEVSSIVLMPLNQFGVFVKMNLPKSFYQSSSCGLRCHIFGIIRRRTQTHTSMKNGHRF